MSNRKKTVNLFTILLAVLSLALTFAIIQPTSVTGYLLCAFISFTVYFFLWLICGQIIPQYVRARNKK